MAFLILGYRVERPVQGGPVNRSGMSEKLVNTWCLLFAAYVYAWATRWTWRPDARGQLWPGRFFTAQAEAILRGRLWVNPVDLPGECFTVAGHCYGYFGVVPSLLRMPFLWLTGPGQPDFSAVVVALMAGISCWAGLDLCRRVLQTVRSLTRRQRGLALGAYALVMGPASVLVMLSDPYVYQEAILWGIAGATLGSNLLWRWSRDRQLWQLAAAATCFTVSAGSRPTTVAVGAIIALGLGVTHRAQLVADRRLLTRTVLLGLLPAMMTFGVYFAKFGAPLPALDTYQQSTSSSFQTVVEKNDGHMSGPRFAPTVLFAFLRPDAVSVSSEWPWFKFRFGDGPDRQPITYLPPLREGSVFVERATSISTVMPLALLATIASITHLTRESRRRRKLRLELVILLALCTPPIILSLSYGVTNRYLGEFYPLLAIGSAFSAVLIPRLVRWSRQTRLFVGSIVAASIALSLVMVPTLTTQYCWIWLTGVLVD